jgi:dTDP-4-dehydrorhamnose reductase
VGGEHPLWPDLADAVPEERLEALLADPCPPDIVGVNHYLSAERFLDERLERYPEVEPGGNGRDRYVDVQALRVAGLRVAGLENLLEEAWERYRLPLAVTEVHNGSSRDEQLRWLKEAWDGALRLRARGVDVRAVTAWALLGSHDWDSLLTRQAGRYEPGVFDARGPRPRPTALARMVRDLARTGGADHPALDAPGWWHRRERFAWAPTGCCPSTLPRRLQAPFAGPRRPRPLLVVGGGGALADALAGLCAVRGLPCHAAPRREVDAADPASVAAALDRWRPWAVVNAAGFARVDRAEGSAARCRRANVRAAEVLARACAAAGVPLLAFSSHLVFDGAKDGPYLEGDAVAPLSVYGAAKAEAERAVLGAFPDVLLVRAGPFFGPWDERNLLTRAVRAVASGRRFAAAADVTVSPSYLPDLADAALDLLTDGESGLWHLPSDGAATWAELAREAVRAAGLDPRRVLEVSAAEAGWVAPRPRRSVLRSGRGILMPPLGEALAYYADALRASPPRTSAGFFLRSFRVPG